MATATCSAAGPVRLPLRVCSMKSTPSCTVNSQSCSVGKDRRAARGGGEAGVAAHRLWAQGATPRQPPHGDARIPRAPSTHLHVAHVLLQQRGVVHQILVGLGEVVRHLQGTGGRAGTGGGQKWRAEAGRACRRRGWGTETRGSEARACGGEGGGSAGTGGGGDGQHRRRSRPSRAPRPRGCGCLPPHPRPERSADTRL